jgi:nicotinate phosphoribosyltransferase
MLKKFSQSLALNTDLYELTMAAGYFDNGLNTSATFEMFIREFPANRSYLVSAGLQHVINYIQNLKFEKEDIYYVKNQSSFKHVSSDFFDYLSDMEFSGDVWAIPEGEIFFPREPMLRVTAPIIQAQIIETFLLSMLNFQTLIATKSSRVVQAANLDGMKRGVMEFGSRRAHGPEASVLAARASYIAGCLGTSNVLAGKEFDIPIYGTAAHSWTLAFKSEIKAFEAYHRVFPESTILLIDTFDIEQGVKNAIKLGKKFNGVRIDSGDLLEYSRMVRQILDENGYEDTIIIASGDLNEYKIKELVDKKAPINSFGVGTQMVTSKDAPSLGGIYKLVETEKDGKAQFKAKFSKDKATYPGKKQVYRIIDEEGNYQKDIIGLIDENISEKHETLLQEIIRNGQLICKFPELRDIQGRFSQKLEKLNQKYKQLEKPEMYPVEYSENLQKLFNKLRDR